MTDKLRRLLDKVEPKFTKGGKYHKYYGLFEMVDTLCCTARRTAPLAHRMCAMRSI